MPVLTRSDRLRGCDPEIANRQQGAERIAAWAKPRRPPSSRSTMAITPATFSPNASTRLDRQQRTAARGHHVLDDHHALAGFHGPFDIASAPVGLGFLADHEALERQAPLTGQRHDRGGDRIGADRHAPTASGRSVGHQLRMPSPIRLAPRPSSVT